MTCCENEEPPPCEVSECPYTPSPGKEGKLAEQNVYASWVAEHLHTLGDAVLGVIPWPDDPLEKELLLEQLTFLRRKEAQLVAAQAARQRSVHG